MNNLQGSFSKFFMKSLRSWKKSVFFKKPPKLSVFGINLSLIWLISSKVGSLIVERPNRTLSFSVFFLFDDNFKVGCSVLYAICNLHGRFQVCTLDIGTEYALQISMVRLNKISVMFIVLFNLAIPNEKLKFESYKRLRRFKRELKECISCLVSSISARIPSRRKPLCI